MTLPHISIVLAVVGIVFVCFWLIEQIEQARVRRAKERFLADNPETSDITFLNRIGPHDEFDWNAALRIRQIISEEFSLPAQTIGPDTTFQELSKITWDGGDSVELIMRIESDFHFEIPHREAEGIETVRQMIKVVTEQARPREKVVRA